MAEEDVVIVRAVRSGDTEAFRTLVERHKGRLYGVLLRLVGDPAEAEELAHETFVKGFRGLAEFRGESSFGTWLVQIGIHAARDRMRSARRHGVVSIEALREVHGSRFDPPDTSSAADPGFEVEAEEQRRMMHRALAALPPEYREVLVLKHLEGWPYGQIAAATGDSVGTLKVRAFRARHLLRERLTDMGWNPCAGEGDSPRMGPRLVRESSDG